MRLNQYAETNIALGSDVTITIVSTADELEVAGLLHRLWHDIYVFERQFSRFLPMSELSVFNRSAGLEIPITPEFRDLLLAAKELGEQTGGLFNPFILPALQRAGYTKSFVERYADDEHDDHSIKKVVSVSELKIKQNSAVIPYGTAIDIGGCGKGYLAEQLAKSIPDWVQGYWLSLGGDIVAAGHDVNKKPWRVDVQSAANPNTNSDWVVMGSKKTFAAATSGTITRKGTRNGQKWHHIIDPKTLKPTNTDVQLATIYSGSALQADVLASCAVLLGSSKALMYLKEQGVKAALLQCLAGDGRRFEKHFGVALCDKKANANINLKAKIYA